MLPDGLVITPSFVTVDEETALVQAIGLSSVKTPFTRDREKIYRYGPGVTASGYKSGTVIEEVPDFLQQLAERLVSLGLAESASDAISVNEYMVGQDIGFHTDNTLSGPVISSLGLLGDAVMGFQDRRSTIEVPFPRRALLQMTGACRHPPWRHCIYPVTQHRISIVFRRT